MPNGNLQPIGFGPCCNLTLGMHPTPHQLQSLDSCAGARVMPSVKGFVLSKQSGF